MLPRSAEAWISVAIGGVLLVFFPRILQYVFAPASFTWTFVDRDGAPLPYTQSAFFVLDVGVLAVALTLIADGALHVTSDRRAVIAGAVLSAACAAINAFVALWTRPDIGLQLLPVLGAIVGVYLTLVRVGQLRAA